jgi:hypothetical protein
MSDSTPPGDAGNSGEWAPGDYTDGKKPGEWETSYPPKARKGIQCETAYLVLLFFGCVAGVFYVLFKLCNEPLTSQLSTDDAKSIGDKSTMFLGFFGAWCCGTLGGCSFGIKWMYHSVAKRLWHEDRRLWRLLSPHLSGVVSLVMVLLVASGLLQIFDKEFVERPIGVMAFSFLVGYFSDKALAKMAEVADTLFGAQKRDKRN